MTALTAAPTAPGSEAHLPAAVEDLLVPAGVVRLRLRRAVAIGDELDAFLLTAALWQLAEDRLHPDPMQLRRAAAFVRPSAPGLARIAAGAASVASPPTPAALALRRASRVLAQNAVTHARAVLGDISAPVSLPEIGPWAIRRLGDAPTRLPAGFTGFDQHPDDVRELARRYLDGVDDPAAPVCAVGVRTSGAYLAPLCAAALESLSGVPASVLSLRPGRPLHRDERARLRDHARAGGRVVIIDDPPGTGTALGSAAATVVASGVPPAAITLLVALFDEEPPDALGGWRQVTLPWPDWSIHRRLDAAPDAFAAILGPDRRMCGISRLDVSPRGGRAHAAARFRIEVAAPGTDAVEVMDLLAEGAGLGLFGAPALAARALGDRVPEVFGFADGLLFSRFLPERSPDAPGPAARIVAEYAAERAARLPVARDPTQRMLGREPAWQVCARVLARPFGPGAPVAELTIGQIVRRLCRPAAPCLVDGDTEPDLWHEDEAGTLRKTGFHQGTYSHFDALCFDPVFDLAGAAATADRGYQDALRSEFAALTGRTADAERWLLYRLAHAVRAARASTVTRAEADRRLARAVCDYLAELYLDDAGTPATGELCAIDLDGVLESDRFGFPAPTPAGMLALRALIRHGFRPVLASGRSAADVQDRCDAFRLAGGVAEYGAAWYDAAAGAWTDTRTPRDRELLDAARAALVRYARSEIDPLYRYVIRIHDRAHGPSAILTDDAAALAVPGLRLVAGEDQVDVITEGIDKTRGLDALAARLGSGGWALAVGDGPADAGMLHGARLGIAPANAHAALREAGIPRTRHAYQRGLLDACSALLGHRPGDCARCRPPRVSARSRAVLAILAAPEPQPFGLAGAALRIAGHLADRDPEPRS